MKADASLSLLQLCLCLFMIELCLLTIPMGPRNSAAVSKPQVCSFSSDDFLTPNHSYLSVDTTLAEKFSFKVLCID